MRIGVAAIMHESNTFSAAPTSIDAFEVVEGRALLDQHVDTYDEIAGFISALRACNANLHPLLYASATPAGPVPAEAYHVLLGKLLAALNKAPHLDGVLLALHGAMVVEGLPNADAETVRQVRAAIGRKTPLVATHDYHANVSQQLVNDVDALVIYKTNPHVDQRERGVQAATILVRAVRGEVRPTCALAKPEVLFNIVHHNTNLPPMAPLMQAAIEAEKQAGILACSIAAGYQYADVPAMGPSVVVVADGDRALAQREADRLGERIWDVREQLLPSAPGPELAVRQAAASERPPVALLDLGDNIGGGGAGDGTLLLEELLKQAANGWVVTIYDPEAASSCARAGIGATITLSVGGKTDAGHGPALRVAGRIRTLHDGLYEETERRHGGGRYFNQGLTAVMEVGGTAGLTRPLCGGLLVLNSRRTPPNSVHQLTSLGIRPERQRILVLKGAVAPRAAYEPICNEIIAVDSPGATAIMRPAAEYRQARKTLYEWCS